MICCHSLREKRKTLYFFQEVNEHEDEQVMQNYTNCESDHYLILA